MRVVLIERIVVRGAASGTARGGMLPLHHDGYSLQLFLHAIQGSIRAFQASNRVARPLGADAVTAPSEKGAEHIRSLQESIAESISAVRKFPS